MEHKLDLICKKCGYRIKDAKESDYRHENGEKRFPYCPQCDNQMIHDFFTDGDYRHTSDSLAIHPDDIPQHKELYPGIEVTLEGQPKFTSMRQQEKYALKSADCYKKRQRVKPKGKRIA